MNYVRFARPLFGVGHVVDSMFLFLTRVFPGCLGEGGSFWSFYVAITVYTGKCALYLLFFFGFLLLPDMHVLVHSRHGRLLLRVVRTLNASRTSILI